jgi:hypothetical protein
MRTTWIVLAMMVACGAWAADSQQSKPQNKSSKLVTENGSPKPGPTINFLTAEQISEAIASGIETADEKREASRQAPPQENSGWWFNFWLVIFNGLLVVTSATQAVVYIKQKGIMEKALLATETAANAADLSAKSARSQSTIMSNQFDLMVEQKNVMQASLEATQKAANTAELSSKASVGTALPNIWLYKLGFADMGVSNLAAKLQSPNIEVTVKNYGGSPAFITQQGIGIFWGNVLPEEPDYSRHAFDVNQETVVESKQPFRLDPVRPYELLPENKVMAILNGNISFWAYGFVQYTDFLGDRHIRRFCKQFVTGGVNPLAYRFIDFDANPKYTESA